MRELLPVRDELGAGSAGDRDRALEDHGQQGIDVVSGGEDVSDELSRLARAPIAAPGRRPVPGAQQLPRSAGQPRREDGEECDRRQRAEDGKEDPEPAFSDRRGERLPGASALKRVEPPGSRRRGSAPPGQSEWWARA